MAVPRDVSERLEKGKEGIIYIAPKYRDESDCISGSVPIQSEVYLSAEIPNGLWPHGFWEPRRATLHFPIVQLSVPRASESSAQSNYRRGEESKSSHRR